MIASGVVTLAVPGGTFAVPALLREPAFVADRPAGRPALHARRPCARSAACSCPCSLTPRGPAGGCFGLAVVLAATTSVSLLDAYLATTPGGLYAVLAVAFGAGANTTFIVAVQALRLLVMVLLAPLAVRLLVGRPGEGRRLGEVRIGHVAARAALGSSHSSWRPSAVWSRK